MNRKKRKQEFYHVGACMALGNYATEFIERNPYSALAIAFRCHVQHLKRKYVITPQTPSERHAYERGKKRGQIEREQIARRPIEITNIRRGVLSDGTDAGIVFGEIDPDVYALFFDGGDRERMNTVHAYFDSKAAVENDDAAAVRYNGRHYMCRVRYEQDGAQLIDMRTGKPFAIVSAADRLYILGKLDSFGCDFVTPNKKAAEDVGE